MKIICHKYSICLAVKNSRLHYRRRLRCYSCADLSPVMRCAKSIMPRRNKPNDVNIVCKGSPSRTRRVQRTSLGITILPRSSTRRTIPVAVPGIFVGGRAPASSADRCHSLSSLYPPPAALASLPSSFHIYSLLVNSRITMLVFVRPGD